MAERSRPVYCTQCGSIVYPGDNFCGVCGARVPPDAPNAAPTANIPTQVPAPPGTPVNWRNLPLAMIIGIGAVLVLLLGIGSVAALTLLRGEEEPPKATAGGEGAPAGATETTEPKQSANESTAARPAGGDSGAQKEAQPDQDGKQKPERGSAPEEAPGHAPGYNLIQTPDGSLSVEVPPSWGVETGEDSEKQGGPGSWSYYAGEYLNSSITTAPSLEAWYSPEASSGVYFVASKSLAQEYSDYELTHSLFFESKAETCTNAGPYKDYDRSPYSGKIQTWYDCGADGATTYSVAAAPEGRECVVVLGARIVSEADRKAIQHIFDTFEVDCGRVTSGPLVTSSASASASGSASASPCPEGSMQNAAGNTCTDLETGEIVRETPLPENPNTNPCPEMWALNEEGRCEEISLP